MPTTQRISRIERRSLIESAATRLFAEKGFVATTVDDIVGAAGVTKPMLYRHFESKQELCILLLERYRDELIAAPLTQFEPGSRDLGHQLPAMLDEWLGYIEAHPEATRLLFTPISGDPEVARVQQSLYRRQAATQASLLREFVPGLSERDAEPLGEALRAGLGAVALWWLDDPGTPRDVPATALRRLTEGTIGALRSEQQR